MCTVTYLPQDEGEFILTFNRDEKFTRVPALPPTIYQQDGRQILYPKDPVGGGTWIAACNDGTIVCLMNGAFKPHIPISPYKHSRGLVPLHYLNYESIFSFYLNYNFENIEPFTLIVFQDKKLFELKWDGEKHVVRNLLHRQPHIWSSVTLYKTEVMTQRKRWFDDWVKERPFFEVDDIRNFHKVGGEGDPEIGILMNRENKIGTVSITSVVISSSDIKMIYEDIQKKTKSEDTIPIRRKKLNGL